MKTLALVIALAACLPGVGPGQAADTAAVGPRLSLETAVARTLVFSPDIAGAQGAVRDAAAARRVALGAYLPSVSLTSSAGWSDQTLATATSGLASASFARIVMNPAADLLEGAHVRVATVDSTSSRSAAR